MSTLDLTTWATLLGTWALVVGTLGFAYWQLRQAQRLHSATTLLDLRERWYSPRLRDSRRTLSHWLVQSKRDEEPEDWEVGVFFELLGTLTRGGVLERRMVWSAFGTWVTSYYALMRQPVDLLGGWRNEANDPMIFGDFEWLAKEFEAFDRRLSPGARHGAEALDDARDILTAESRLRAEGPIGSRP